MQKTISLTVFLIFGFVANTFADTEVKYRGIRAGKAWIYIDGRTAKLTPGQKSLEGHKLVSANKNSIVIIIEGKRFRYKKGKTKGELLDNEFVIYRNQYGSYVAEGAINGNRARFIVDTGASYVVINKKDAKTQNLKFGKKKIKITTATKDEIAYLVTLESVQVGDIKLNNIPAIVSNNENHPRMPLLGMTFLERLEIKKRGNEMSLIYKGD